MGTAVLMAKRMSDAKSEDYCWQPHPAQQGPPEGSMHVSRHNESMHAHERGLFYTTHEQAEEHTSPLLYVTPVRHCTTRRKTALHAL